MRSSSRALKPGAVLATNTSSIKIEPLAEQLQDPSRLVGIHFFNPVAQMQLVEIVHGAATQRSGAAARDLVHAQARQAAAAVQERAGFVVNRILMPYINEALFALAEGIPAAVIDRAGTRFGMPVGPIELADVVGPRRGAARGPVLAAGIQSPRPADPRRACGAEEARAQIRRRVLSCGRDGKAEHPAGQTPDRRRTSRTG